MWIEEVDLSPIIHFLLFRQGGSALDNQDSVFAIDEIDQDIDEYGYPLDEGDEGDEEPKMRSVSGPAKDDPLDRRALLALEKQLILEEPESEFDLHVSTAASSFIQGVLYHHF